jgi:hypothetical protein
MADNKMGGGGSSSGSGVGSTSLASTYPVNTLMEIKLSPPAGGTTLRGLVYCTDEISNTIILKKSLVHTTLSSEITVVNADSVVESKTIEVTQDISEEYARELAGVGDLGELSAPLPNVSRKVLEERERRAIRLAEESLSHINQRVS